MTKNNKIVSVASEQELAILRESYPVETSFQRTLYPRLGMYSQDVTEGKGKSMKVVAEAGTFFTEKQTEKVNEETGKKVWEKTEVGNEIELIVLFQRKQLKFYDGEKYTSSPVYDTEDEVLPLFKDKVEVDRGTPKELKSREIYQGVSGKGKKISKLEDNRILYVLYNGKLYQLNLRGTSMYAFMTYARQVTPNTVLTRITSESKENGAISWNQMKFEAKRVITKKEAEEVMGHLEDIKGDISAEKGFYAATQANVVESEADRAFRGM